MTKIKKKRKNVFYIYVTVNSSNLSTYGLS